MKASGAKSYVIQYRNRQTGRSWRKTIGKHGPLMTLHQARDIARGYLADAMRGADPIVERAARHDGRTMRDLARDYMSKHAIPKKRPRSAAMDQSMLDNKVLPPLGSLDVGDVTHADIQSLHNGLAGTPYQANRVLALLSKMFELAARWGWRTDNPVRGVPRKQPKKSRLWLNDGSCIRLRPEHRNHVWSYDFVHCRTDDGKPFRTLNILDEFSRECLSIRVKRKLNSTDVIDALTDLFILRGPPAYVRSDNGPEFVAKDVRAWIEAVGARTAFIEPGSPWENGYVESFNARFRDELLNREIFYSLKEAQVIIEGWRKHYNTKRPHSSLGYRPPAPATIVQMDPRPVMH